MKGDWGLTGVGVCNPFFQWNSYVKRVEEIGRERMGDSEDQSSSIDKYSAWESYRQQGKVEYKNYFTTQRMHEISFCVWGGK